MSKTDPGWIYILVIAIIIAFIWKPVIAPQITKMRGAFQNDEQIARGQRYFDDTLRWGNQGVSCATCHIEGHAPPEAAIGDKIDFQYVPLNGVYKKYVTGALANDADLAGKVNTCITMQRRLNSPSLTTTNVVMQDIIAYLQTIR